MLEQLESFIRNNPRLVALTGAGLSAASGIPTYRDDSGTWQRSDPIQHGDFVSKPAARQRYWARSMAGWHTIAAARPNRAHHALAQLELSGHIKLLVTQNVDRLHQQAGHREVIDLHGRMDRVQCLLCAAETDRSDLQPILETLNPHYDAQLAVARPDGDAEVADSIVANFQLPECSACGGTLMPAVVFFGGTVPRPLVEQINRAIDEADAMLVAGSSLTVFSGFRFARRAAEQGKPLLIINRGQTRGDELASLKLNCDAAEALDYLATRLARASGSVA